MDKIKKIITSYLSRIEVHPKWGEDEELIKVLAPLKENGNKKVTDLSAIIKNQTDKIRQTSLYKKDREFVVFIEEFIKNVDKNANIYLNDCDVKNNGLINQILPREISAHILGFLTKKDLTNAKTVCKYWNQLISAYYPTELTVGMVGYKGFGRQKVLNVIATRYNVTPVEVGGDFYLDLFFNDFKIHFWDLTFSANRKSTKILDMDMLVLSVDRFNKNQTEELFEQLQKDILDYKNFPKLMIFFQNQAYEGFPEILEKSQINNNDRLICSLQDETGFKSLLPKIFEIYQRPETNEKIKQIQKARKANEEIPNEQKFVV